jgi:predicted nucleic acid-binding Zn ribbon protein
MKETNTFKQSFNKAISNLNDQITESHKEQIIALNEKYPAVQKRMIMGFIIFALLVFPCFFSYVIYEDTIWLIGTFLLFACNMGWAGHFVHNNHEFYDELAIIHQNNEGARFKSIVFYVIMIMLIISAVVLILLRLWRGVF